MKYQDLYKAGRISTLADSLSKRSQIVMAERQEKQRELFWMKRGHVDTEEIKKPVPAEVKRKLMMEKLQKWKAEKLKKLEEARKKQKPIFKTGVVHRKATGSPYLFTRNVSSKHNVQQNNAKVQPGIKEGVMTRSKVKALENVKIQTKPDITNKKTSAGIKKVQENEKVRVTTRSTAKKMENQSTQLKPSVAYNMSNVKTQTKFQNKFCKIETGQKKLIDSHVFKVPKSVMNLPYCKRLTVPNSPKITKKVKESIRLAEKKVENVEDDLCNVERELENIKLDKENVEQSKENKLEEEESNKKEIQVEGTSDLPKVTTPECDDFMPIHFSPYVTVRSGKKRGRRSKKSLVMDVDELIQKEEKQFHCRIFSFRKYIECERKRLLEMCTKWQCIYEDFPEVPADVEGDIDSVVGKTKLLTSDKFIQFKDLIDKCEKGDPLIKVDDLQGFQDWVSIEVEKIDEDFHKLEKRKRNSWRSETKSAEKEKVQKVRAVKNKVKRPVGKSNIRAHILAARKLMKDDNSIGETKLQALVFDEALKAVTPKKKESLLVDVLNSEMKKKLNSTIKTPKQSPVVRARRNSGLEIMVATHKNKFSSPVRMTPDLTKNFTNKEPSPIRSILKSGPSSTSKGCVSFKQYTKINEAGGKERGLSEKYFRASSDDEESPVRLILGDIRNRTPARSTRSQSSKAAARESYSLNRHISPI